MDKGYYLGLDSSAYTTSIAVVDFEGQVICDIREVLKVKLGKKGLRQQEAVFQHVMNLPDLIAQMTKVIKFEDIKAVAATNKPRNLEDSYMPVFKVLQGQGQILSKVLDLPYYEFSHQEGHIGAGIIGTDLENKNEFLSLHISGGTTELLHVKKQNKRYTIKKIGGTKDISAGQLIDRIGVRMMKPFPSGKHLENLSAEGRMLDIKFPIKVQSTWMNLSGVENFFYKLIDNHTYKEEDIAYTLFIILGQFLSKIIISAITEFQISDILIVGGVASNGIIKKALLNQITEKNIGEIYIPEPKFCTDNAIGIAYLGAKMKGDE